MSIFDKKTVNLLLEDKALLSSCKSSLAAINVKVEMENADLYNKILKIIDGLEYSSPSKDKEIYEADKKLFDAIGEFKIAARRKIERSNLDYCGKLVSNISELLSARNEKIKRFKF